jgi:hypothetical protein
VEERLKKSSGPSPRKSPSPDDADAQQSFPGPLTGRAFLLNNADPIFAAIRNGHMASVLPYLSQRAKTLQSSIERASGWYLIFKEI